MCKGKSIKENNNFLSVEEYKLLDISSVQKALHTEHLTEERQNRINKAYEINQASDGSQAPIDAVFLVDKGHEDGKELHCVTENGVIYILNEWKFTKYNKGLITILFARPNQVRRLYDSCELEMPPGIMKKCSNNCKNALNTI